MPSFGLVECNHVFSQKSIHFTVNSLRTSRLQFWQPWKFFLPKIRKTKAHLWETNIQTLFLPHKNLTSSKQLSGHVESNFGKRAGKISEKSPKICPSNIPEIFFGTFFSSCFFFLKKYSSAREKLLDRNQKNYPKTSSNFLLCRTRRIQLWKTFQKTFWEKCEKIFT